jgi:hypothetical protein
MHYRCVSLKFLVLVFRLLLSFLSEFLRGSALELALIDTDRVLMTALSAECLSVREAPLNSWRGIGCLRGARCDDQERKQRRNSV